MGRNQTYLKYNYTGKEIESCNFLKVYNTYEDSNMCLILFTLNEATYEVAKGTEYAYILCFDKTRDVDSDIIENFKDFPGFYKHLLEYKGYNATLYAPREARMESEALNKGYNALGEIHYINEIVSRYYWGMFLASIYKEYHKHNPNASKDDLGINKSTPIKNVPDRVDNPYTKIPTNLITFDLYAIGNYTHDINAKIIEGYSYASAISPVLDLLAIILKHHIKFRRLNRGERLEDFISVSSEKMLKNLEEWFLFGLFDEDLRAETLYEEYEGSNNTLKTNNDYLKAISEQLYKYAYVDDVNEESFRNIYTLDKDNNKKLVNLYRDGSNIFDTFDMITTSLYESLHNNDRVESIVYYDKGPLPVKSFNIEEYKEIIKDEYALLPDLKEYMKEYMDGNKDDADYYEYNDSNHLIRGINLDFTDLVDPYAESNYPELCSMFVLNDYEVCFYIGNKKVKDFTGASIVQEYLSLTGRKFTLNPACRHIEYLCEVGDKEYKDERFREKYPRLTAMYKRGLKLYHEYCVHGEPDPMNVFKNKPKKSAKK